MKQIHLLIILISAVVTTTKAQNYQSFYPNRIVYFKNAGNEIKCLKIDSVKYLNDTVLFPFKNIQQNNYSCLTPFGASWIGDKIIVNNGKNLFFNMNGDTIIIKTNAVLNENWVCYKIKDSIKVMAGIVDFDTLSFLGLLDSVKTISFHAYNKSMVPVDHGINDMEILLSKNYGFIKTFNFLLFPDFEFYSLLYDRFEEFTLSGLSTPSLGIQNFSRLDVFDFKVGDELDIVNEDNNWDPYFNIGYYTSRKTRLIYISRQNFADSVIYSAEREQGTFRRIVTWDSTSYEYIHDTISTTIKRDSLFDKLPGEVILTGDQAYQNYMTSDVHVIKTVPSIRSIFKSNDSCWYSYTEIADGCFLDYDYYKGLGGPYYDCNNFLGIGGQKNELVYYKKDTVEWGTPLVITGITGESISRSLAVYPNPANNFIRIRIPASSTPAFFELFDLQGKVILKKIIESGEDSIDINNIEAGLYMYRLKNKNNTTVTGKLIKE